jgi:uncharacterized YccA/Bax inhibitor family protein
MEMRSSNPVLNNNFWSNLNGTERMTIEGSMQKTGFLLGVTVLSALVSAVLCLNALNSGDGGALIFGLWMIGMVAGTVIALILMFVRPNNPATLMTMYALFEGAFIGAFSVYFESMYEGIVFQAAFGTVGITATMYVMYASKVIRPTPMFNKVLGGLVMSIMLLYLTSFILSMFSGYSVPFLHSTGPIGIGVTVFILVVASLTLISDFGFIESGSRYGAPKNMEWYAAFGILMSLIWIYIEMVRLLWKLNAYRD